MEAQRERRTRLFELADGMGLGLAAMGTHPWADYLDQRIIDTPHYNRLRHELGWVAQRNNTWSLHVHMGVRGADRAIAVCDWMRELLPLLLAASANSPFLDRRDTGLHTVRTEIFTRTFPRCGIPSPFLDWESYAEFVGLLERTGSAVESTQLWWSVRPHHAFGTVEVRICDAQTRGEESFGLAALDRRLHRPDGARLRRARLRRRRRAAARSRDRGEPLAGDPSRHERQADRLPPRQGGRGEGGARGGARVDRSQRAQPWASSPQLPERNGAQRAREALDAGIAIEDVYRDAVRETHRTYTAAKQAA